MSNCKLFSRSETSYRRAAVFRYKFIPVILCSRNQTACAAVIYSRNYRSNRLGGSIFIQEILPLEPPRAVGCRLDGSYLLNLLEQTYPLWEGAVLNSNVLCAITYFWSFVCELTVLLPKTEVENPWYFRSSVCQNTIFFLLFLQNVLIGCLTVKFAYKSEVCDRQVLLNTEPPHKGSQITAFKINIEIHWWIIEMEMVNQYWVWSNDFTTIQAFATNCNS